MAIHVCNVPVALTIGEVPSGFEPLYEVLQTSA